jgi:hypothetical protein
MSEQRLYRVAFFNQGEIYEIYARQVAQGGLYGFVEVEDLVFGERSQIVVDPTEERLQQEFDGVKRFYIPMHSVVRIDEVEKQGKGRITEAGKEDNKVAKFPVPIYTPKGDV